jgi:metal-dependent amidase/aminoacylase/carboxypeptidase family protein
MARDGLFDDCDVILTSHPGDVNAPVHSCYFSSPLNLLLWRICHTPSMPEVGRNVSTLLS